MANPVKQFEIKPIAEFSLAGLDLSFTNSSLFMLLAVVLTWLLFTIGTAQKSLVPSRLQSVCEIIYEFIAGMIRDNTGKDGSIYFPFVFTLFMFILMGNVLGLFPFAFTFTSHIIVTAILAFIVISVVTIFGFVKNGTKFLSLFVPPNIPLAMLILIVPLEIISFLIRPLTLSMRLFANMMAGHMIMKVFAGFAVMLVGGGTVGYFMVALPVAVNVGVYALELLVAMLHAYIFTVLTCAYLKDTVDLHH